MKGSGIIIKAAKNDTPLLLKRVGTRDSEGYDRGEMFAATAG